MKRLPYGISNFSYLINNKYHFVDKTMFIERLERESNKYHFFIRPRKFGKSLFLSMLHHYYNVNEAENFQKLFGNLYIGQNPTPDRNRYLVMDFDFSGLKTSSENDFIEAFASRIQTTVKTFFTLYRNIFPDADDLLRQLDADKPGVASMQLVYSRMRASGVPLYIIIDEYDPFANDLIAMGGNEVYKKMIRANGIVRDFYEILKIGTKNIVEHIFITGISPVMLDDLTSGFNIASNLTGERRYNNMLGFVKNDIDMIIETCGINNKLIDIDIERYYDGYLFEEKAADRIYNPSMILYYLDQIINTGESPKNVIDDNLKTDYSRLQRLTGNRENREKLIFIAKEKSILSNIITRFSIDRLDDNQYFISLLFYMGLLTIDKAEEGMLRLKIPNYSIETLYWEYIVEMTRETIDSSIDVSKLEAGIRDLAFRANPKPYLDYVSEIVKEFSNRDLMNLDEKYIKILMFSTFFQSNIYLPVSEEEVSDGYMDIFLERRDENIKYEWIFELKYVKEKDRKNLPEIRRKAMEQLERYASSRRMKQKKDLKKAALIFIGKKGYEVVAVD